MLVYRKAAIGERTERERERGEETAAATHLASSDVTVLNGIMEEGLAALVRMVPRLLDSIRHVLVEKVEGKHTDRLRRTCWR